MLTDLFPKVHLSYSTLQLLGCVLDGFAAWLFEHGYHRALVCRHLRTTRRVDAALRRCGCSSLSTITREALRACSPKVARDDAPLASTVRALERYLDEQRLLPPTLPPGRKEVLLAEYGVYLAEVRGLAEPTTGHHLSTVSQLLDHLAYETSPSCLNALSRGDLEAFVRVASQRRGRESLQHVVARLRSFARFLGGRGDAPPGLETQIDTPRVYRGERLPRCLPWETVRSFLSSIDRSTRIGVRDYAIFLLMATYGLRCCEIVALKLSDIEWRSGRMEVPPCKTHSQRALPLMEPAGEALVDYIRRGRPALPYREVFLRSRAPAGPLTPDAVTKAFAVWARRCAVKIPFYGAHCLRHSYAVHLLRQGTPLKTIGDVLGHRNAESTSVYLRLAVEDLRDVALCLPEASCAEGMGEVTP